MLPPPESSEKYFPSIEIDSATSSLACHCEYPIGCAAISLRKVGLLRYTRNIACLCGTPMGMNVATPGQIPPTPLFKRGERGDFRTDGDFGTHDRPWRVVYGVIIGSEVLTEADASQGNCWRKRGSLAWKRRISSMPYLSMATRASLPEEVMSRAAESMRVGILSKT
jgi:hypothetical protein